MLEKCGQLLEEYKTKTSYNEIVRQQGVAGLARNKKVIAEYIRNQLMEDLAEDKLTHPELFDPFTGEDRRKK